MRESNFVSIQKTGIRPGQVWRQWQRRDPCRRIAAPGGVKAEPRGPYSRSRALHVATVLTCGLYASSHPAELHRTRKGAQRWKLICRTSERVRQHRHARAARLLSCVGTTWVKTRCPIGRWARPEEIAGRGRVPGKPGRQLRNRPHVGRGWRFERQYVTLLMEDAGLSLLLSGRPGCLGHGPPCQPRTT